MVSRFFKVVVLLVLVLSFNFSHADAAGTVMWGKTELKLGQIGKVTIGGETELVKLESDGSLSVVRVLKIGEEFRVYSYKNDHSGLYGVGGGSFIRAEKHVKYETPSKSKLALLQQMSESPAPVQPSKPNPSVGSGLEIIPGAPTNFQNCTKLREYYSNGVKEGHPAYASKHDRDNDGWACEKN